MGALFVLNVLQVRRSFSISWRLYPSPCSFIMSMILLADSVVLANCLMNGWAVRLPRLQSLLATVSPQPEHSVYRPFPKQIGNSHSSSRIDQGRVNVVKHGDSPLSVG